MAKVKRQGISKRTRFEIFKRDGWKCKYCGNRPTVSPLHVDHAIAVANGGTNDPANLVTACADCNGGKSAVPLEERKFQALQIDEAKREQAEQILEYLKIEKGVYDAKQEVAAEAVAKWKSHFGEPPDAALVNTFGRSSAEFGLARVLEAIDIAAGSGLYGKRVVRYFYGVLRNWRKGNPKPGKPKKALPVVEYVPVSDDDRKRLQVAIDEDCEGYVPGFVFVVSGASGPLLVRHFESWFLLERLLRHGMPGAPRMLAAMPGAETVEAWVRNIMAKHAVDGCAGWFQSNPTTLAFCDALNKGMPSWLEYLEGDGPLIQRATPQEVRKAIVEHYGATVEYEKYVRSDHFVSVGLVRDETISAFIDQTCGVYAHSQLLPEFSEELASSKSLRLGAFELIETSDRNCSADEYSFVIRKHLSDGSVEESK